MIRPLLAFLLAAKLSASAAHPRFPITEYGALGDGTTLNTIAIQKTIDAAAAAGGGTVEIPAGTFLSGAVFLKPGVSLHLHKDAVLLGSKNIGDYPKQMTRIEGRIQPWRTALVNASEIDGLHLHGEGVLDGNGIEYWARFWQRRRENPQCTNLEIERPRLLYLERCRNIRIQGLTLRYSGFWNLHLYNCEDALIKDVSILAPTRTTGHRHYMSAEILAEQLRHESARHEPVKDNILGPSTDGIDIDSSRRITIRRCYISVNDDNIALKGTKGPLAHKDRESPPVEDILIEDCDFGDGNGMITCGSEATLIRNVTVRNCRILGDATAITLKLRPDTPQRYENITLENITINGRGRLFNVAPWTQFFDLQGHDPPPSVVSGLTLRNIRGQVVTLGSLRGNPIDTLENITLENIDLQVADPDFKVGPLRNATLRAVRVNDRDFTLPPATP